MAANLYYDDQQRLIATTDDELVIYFKSLQGVSLVQNLPFTAPCPVVALYKINTSGVLPKYISKNGTAPSQRIFAQVLPAATIPYDSICGGVTYATIVPAPVTAAAFMNIINYYRTEDLSELYFTEDGSDIYRIETP